MHRALAETVALFEAGLARCTRPEDRSLVSDYLSALAPILAAAALGENVLARLDSVERLFGNTWLIDDTRFRPALEKWRQFRSEYEHWVFSGMTVNERLCVLGLMEEYDHAIRSRDRAGGHLAATGLLAAYSLKAAALFGIPALVLSFLISWLTASYLEVRVKWRPMWAIPAAICCALIAGLMCGFLFRLSMWAPPAFAAATDLVLILFLLFLSRRRKPVGQ